MPEKASGTGETSLAGRMRVLAVELKPDGRGRLCLPARRIGQIRSLAERADRMKSTCLDGGTALESLYNGVRMMENCAAQALEERANSLPSSGGKPRILAIARALVGGGDIRLNRDSLMLALASFDDVQCLEMAELWTVPEALRICLVEAYCEAAEEALHIATERGRAEKWVGTGEARLGKITPAFVERALNILADLEENELHGEIERQLQKQGESTEQAIREAHSHEAMVRMRLENLLCGKRLVDALDWSECFEQLSSVEAELRYDPLGTYPDMEADSRAAVRRQVAVIAQRVGVGELTVARYAVSAAQAARHDGAPESKQTVCYWLYDDAGRAELLKRMGVTNCRLPAIVPDPVGIRSAWGIAVLFAGIYLLFQAAVKSIWLVFPGIPVAWCGATALLGRCFPHFAKPAKLLKMEINSVPETLRTLVVMPALLSSKERAAEICDQVEAMGSLEQDENISMLILGDYADGDEEHAPGDAEIVEYVKSRIRDMNVRAGREQHFYLHRNRRLLEADGRWMGRDRKRGALMDLNRLLLGRTGAETAFEAEGEACKLLAGRYSYVLTIDADTRFLPGTVQRMIGTIAHPLNAPRIEGGIRKGFAVLQPQMEMMASACVNGFVRLFSGKGGLNAYPVSISNFWQDMTGEGIFGGKGLYAVRPFMKALEGALPEGRILSHDLIEGTLARAALVSDICFYDGFPATLGSFMRRLNRWTRGDWQLLPMVFSMKKYPADGKRLGMAARVRLADNLIRSLYAPALLGVLTTAIWLGNMPALIAGLLSAFSSPLLDLPRMNAAAWRRAMAELAILPVTAAQSADAVIRTLWRLAFSGKHLLDWVTSADAEGISGGQALPCRLAAILMLPGLLVPGCAAAAAALAILFTVGPRWIEELEQSRTENSGDLSGHAAEVFHALAADTWRFFDRWVTAESHDLPPDNVQIDPDVGPARRTSPTNAGLYLMGCVSAHALQLIPREEMIGRMERTVCSMEKLEKWKGHLYNWYDVDTLRPLSPRYVSAVDSGNCAAALLLCASAVGEDAPELAERMAALAKQMDFSALYDEERSLFVIGADVEHNRLSESHYDLLASEARILSFTAMMLGEAPLKHWKHLSRRTAAANGRAVLQSWSGTMFEYLMPELMMPAPGGTLLNDAVTGAIEAQRMLGRHRKRPWGVSESGYCAFDMHLNYQYRAFGLRKLALSGSAADNVVAPYASLLAAAVQPEAVLKNIEHMQAMGWRGEYGFYEAADYQNCDFNGLPRVVRSYMAHHQGMALCALCNALTGGILTKHFMRIPQAQALRLLLEEKQASPVRAKGGAEKPQEPIRTKRFAGWSRTAKPDRRIADAHVLGGAGATALVTADGAVHYWKNDIQATRFQGDLLNRNDGACVHLRRERTGETAVFGEKSVQYEPGKAVLSAELGPLQCRMTVCISPEDGALLKRIEIVNDSPNAETVKIADCVPVALGKIADMMAHAVFRNLFVESKRLSGSAVQLERRKREPDEHCPKLLHMVSTPGSVRCETNLDRLTGRMGSTMVPGGICWEMNGTMGAVLNPCTAIQSAVTVEPGQRTSLHFALGLTEDEDVQAWLRRNYADSACERAEQLASTQARAMLGFLGMEPGSHALAQRLSAMLMDRRLSAEEKTRGSGGEAARSDLWGIGISGDFPILMMRAHRREEIPRVRELIRLHEFYRTLGLRVDLVLVNESENDYDQPVRDGLTDAVAFSTLNGLRGVPGGVHILEGRNLTDREKEALRKATAVDFDAAQEMAVQMRSALRRLNRTRKDMSPMPLGEDCLAALPAENGYGMFLPDNRYAIDVFPDRTTPAPWANIMANDGFGVLMTERGGGFLWAGNSRSGRLTQFHNDVLNEGWGWMFYLVDETENTWLRLLPGREPMMHWRVVYSPTETVYCFETEKVCGEMAFCVHADSPELRVHTTIRSSADGKYRIVGFVDWLMGTDVLDAGFVHTWNRDGACFATGSAAGVGYFAAANARVRAGGIRNFFLGSGGIQSPDGLGMPVERSAGWMLEIPVQLKSNRPFRLDWAIGHAAEFQQAYGRVRAFYSRPNYEEIRDDVQSRWSRRAECLAIRTPDEQLNRLANGWLLHQTLTGRIRARTGLYQPGGAFGFRDQLQDMLALLPSEPARVREHILRCAAHQFEDGDVMHWWHEPFLGVRTRISDDMLFLPYVTAKYVHWTGDDTVLNERVFYLENVEIEPGREDRFCEMHPGKNAGTLHEHCMRAFWRAAQTGEHGLALMGAGDWNDGMNRVGVYGLGESVWLSEFMAVCAREYAQCAPDEADKTWLTALSEQMCTAVEKHGWDGEWYLRAYMDSGLPLGSASGSSCRIDAISQAWAVLADLNPERCWQAMDSAWDLLVDQEHAVVRLLTPPFGDDAVDPGYIRGYPGGIRENGAQYTHGACWLLLALIRMGDAKRAHRMLQMLIPANHADTKEKADIYRTEPYVLAADVYEGAHAGRGGWTWYTGSAAWLYGCILALLGFERQGNRVRMNTLLGDWPEVSLSMTVGKSKYRLVSNRDTQVVTLDGKPQQDAWIELIDDGALHEAFFPPRKEK